MGGIDGADDGEEQVVDGVRELETKVWAAIDRQIRAKGSVIWYL